MSQKIDKNGHGSDGEFDASKSRVDIASDSISVGIIHSEFRGPTDCFGSSRPDGGEQGDSAHNEGYPGDEIVDLGTICKDIEPLKYNGRNLRIEKAGMSVDNLDGSGFSIDNFYSFITFRHEKIMVNVPRLPMFSIKVTYPYFPIISRISNMFKCPAVIKRYGNFFRKSKFSASDRHRNP